MKKFLMIILAVFAFTLMSSMDAQAYGCADSYYGGGYYGGAQKYAYPVFSNCGSPARVGGYFGAGSAYIVGLRPGYYEPAPINRCTTWGGCGTRYARVGGYYGGGSYGYYGGNYYPSYSGAGYRSNYIYHGPI